MLIITTNTVHTAQKKWSFQLRISSVNVQFPADLVTFTEEIINGKFHFLCSDKNPFLWYYQKIIYVSSNQENENKIYLDWNCPEQPSFQM